MAVEHNKNSECKAEEDAKLNLQAATTVFFLCYLVVGLVFGCLLRPCITYFGKTVEIHEFEDKPICCETEDEKYKFLDGQPNKKLKKS